MYNRIRENISRRVSLSAQELVEIENCARKVALKKKSRLLHSGEVCNYLVFVNTGAVRSFSADNKGVEQIVQFAFEDNWVSDLYSYVSEAPAILSIESMEDSELLLFYKEDMEKLYQTIPALERWMRLLLQNAYVRLQRRLVLSLSMPAEERYAELLQSYPDILNRVPLIYIASYLGITPESLSRIRRQLSAK
ncbi:CRP-like cAMP-binding protein [Filimonas zeae]|uniref:cAMP-binding protein n=1 Tax=Filimonas zeae TaxID=1737353 RepID=A0A917J6H6_9BACT|nr:Crp/Fnr family transcriptional regulator [Filimonas zeae]MDR6342557.1 CRP-like cAMP-binding protein [Filimonas zeae]GGH81794.1 cAMP-binding protein [Filimonas zeae]